MFKKTIIIVTLLLTGGIAILGAGFFLLPRLLNMELVRKEAAAITERSFPGNAVTFDTLTLQWLPFPHLTAKNIAITSEDALLVLPEVLLYPQWFRLASEHAFFGKIIVTRPSLTVHNPAAWLTSFAASPPPGSSISITDGHILLEKPATPEWHRIKWPLTFDRLNATFTTTPAGTFLYDINAGLNVAEKISLKGRHDSGTAAYSMDVRAKQVDFAQLLMPFANGRLVPANKKIDSAFSITGNGPDTWEMLVRGDLPELLLAGDRQIPLLGGRFTGKIRKEGSAYHGTIMDLETLRQKASIKGTVERRHHDEKGGGTPFWSIALTGKDLDLTAIREAVLALWQGHPAADTTCRIIKGGTASSASFSFQGGAAALQRLSAMTITAEVTGAAIHVPGAALDLTDAWGPVRIENGSLSGHNLRASLGKSRGKNGALFLDIDRDSDRFSLDMELDVDLLELQPVLQRLVPHKDFVHEVSLFSDINGRAQGKLVMEGTLHDLNTTVLVTDANGSFSYQRLPWPVTLQNLSLLVSGKKVQWQRGKGTVGPHRVDNVEGEATWTDTPLLTIRKLSGSLDAAPFFDLLQQIGAVQKKLPTFVRELSGRMDIRDAALSGRLFQPATWEFSLTAQCDTLSCNLGDTTQNATLTNLSAHLSESSFTFSAKLWLLSQLLDMEADFSHQRFSNWKGWALFNGMLQQPLVSWLADVSFLPEHFFPKTPSVLEGMRLTFHNGLQGVHGAIRSFADKKAPAALLDLTFGNNASILSGQVEFLGEGKSAKIGLEQKKKDGTDSFFLSFDGTLAAAEINQLFKESPFLAGTISGTATVEAEKSGLGPVFMSGTVKGEDLRWSAGGKLFPMTLQRLHMTGSKETLHLHEALLHKEDEALNVRGSLAFTPQKLATDLEITGGMVRWTTLDRLVGPARKDTDATFFGRSLRGTVRFDIGQLTQSPHLFDTPAETKNHSRTVSQARGTIELQPGQPTMVRLDRAEKCGVRFQGTLFPFSATHPDSLDLSTSLTTPPTFQDFFSCLGTENDLIDGTFSLTGHLHGKPENWRKGSVKLFSPKGRINRLTFFSKVLSVINLTDILSAAGSGAGLSYEPLEITANVAKNTVSIEKGVINGDGLKIYAKGDIELAGPTVDLTLLFAPLKTIDAVVGKIPILNKMFTGKHGTVFAIPVAVKGSVDEPQVSYLPASEVGLGFINLIGDTLSLPFQIISPILPDAPKEKK